VVLGGAFSELPGLGELIHMPAPRALALRTTGATYPGRPEQVRAVRADLRGLLDRCPMADDVILCASELAANAALHSHSAWPGGEFTVRVKVSPGDYAWIEVEDNGGPWRRHTGSGTLTVSLGSGTVRA
jgi:anti-sigma regulatory factor (Ser/Thr protein kinase)